MSIEDNIKKIVRPDIKIDTEKNIFKINDIDLSLFCYWNITFSKGQWFFTIKNKEENNNDINVDIGEINKIFAYEIGERIVKDLQKNMNLLKD